MNFFQILSLGFGAYVAYCVIKVVVYIFRVIAEWKIFTKAGEKGWKTFIPFVNTYTQYKITWKKSLYWLYLPICVIYYFSVYWFKNYLLSDASNPTLANVILVLLVVFGIAKVVMDIISYAKLSKAFGHGFGYTIGLIFLRPIFIMILGFGSAEYQGGDNWPEKIETAV